MIGLYTVSTQVSDMARRRMKSKIQPAVQELYFAGPQLIVPQGGTRTNFYVDLSQVASIINRRFYRQGLNWAVAGFKFTTGISEGSIEINKLPNTWIMSNAWEKGFRAWQEMNKEAMTDASVKPKFLDFKIYADAEHHQAGFGSNLVPVAGTPSAGSFASQGEWIASKFSIPDTTTHNSYDREILATGANYPGAGASGLNAVSLIEGYAASRSLPYTEDPNTPTDSSDADGAAPQNFLAALTNQGTEQTAEVLDNLITDNDEAPYPFEGGTNPGTGGGGTFTNPYSDTMYPGGANQLPGLQLHDFAYWKNTSETITLTHSLMGGNFPCGLVKVSVTNQDDRDGGMTMLVKLVPGHHRGYLADPMTEM